MTFVKLCSYHQVNYSYRERLSSWHKTDNACLVALGTATAHQELTKRYFKMLTTYDSSGTSTNLFLINTGGICVYFMYKGKGNELSMLC